MAIIALFAQQTFFLGDDLLPWLLLAFGAALVVANIAALVRPPPADPDLPGSQRLERAPIRRVAPMMVLGLVLSIWALATLLS